MKKLMPLAAVVLIALLGACASDPRQSTAPAANAYTDQQKDMFTGCLAPMILIRNVVADKLAGKSEMEAMQDSGGIIDRPIADRIYADAFADPWSYMTTRFGECAARYPAITTADPGVADECLQRALIGEMALVDRTAGRPKDATYQELPRPDDARDRGIVDAIYALPDATDAGYRYPGDIWDNCMGRRRSGN